MRWSLLNQHSTCTALFSFLTPIMYLSLRVLLAFGSAVFTSWLATFSFECYYQGPRVGSAVHARDQEPPFPGATADNLFWFLQISDIHLSRVNRLAVANDLRSFCTETVSTIAPALVLVTGDLTHAKFPNERSSQQFEEEWQAYNNILRETRVGERRPWLDIRGNHDAFDVESRTHRNNMFMKYSSGYTRHDSYSYSYTHSTAFGHYAFLALDACPSPGPRRPFNFFGVLHDEDLSVLRSLASQSAQLSPNLTLWFSHYPSATISADHRALRELMSPAVAHVCGHLHTLAGLVPRLYGRHPSGHLELELGDFKDNRRFRLLAMDHDLFSFTDTTLHHWPLLLVTCPMDSRFSVPGREPVGRTAHSTHVRVLAFSPHGVKLVQVWLDGHPLPPTTEVQNGPLYTTPWDPKKVATGLHTITVAVEDAAGNRRNTSHQFSLDGHVSPLSRLPEILLLTDNRSLWRMVFLFVWLSLLVTLTVSWLNRAQPVHFQPLVRCRAVFYPLIVFLLYFGTGPWCVGEIVTGKYGLIWVHGVQISTHFIPGSLTYLFGAMQLFFWYIPLTCHLNLLLSPSPSRCPLPRHLSMIPLFFLHCGWCLTFSPYGAVALLISPGVSWSILLSLYLLLRSWRVSSRLSV